MGRGTGRWRGTLGFLLLAIVSCAPAGAQEIGVAVAGAVRRPGAHAMPAGARLSFLIETAGGYADNAWLPGAILRRKSAAAASKEALSKRIARVEAEALSVPGNEEAKRAFFRSLKAIEPPGAMRAPLAHLRLLKGSGKDLPLEDGDVLEVPAAIKPVAVAGAVGDPGRSPFPHSEKSGYLDYIREAGGFSADADPDRAYLVRPGLPAVVLREKWIRWNAAKSRWEFSPLAGGAPAVEPGDTIAVPKKPPAGSWASRLAGLPGLLMDIAAATGVVVDPP